MALLLSGLMANDGLADGFRSVPVDSRMRMYWRVFGPAWTPREMDYELDQLKLAGVGGVDVYFMYPVALDDPAQGIKNLKFGSPEFLESFRYAANAAQSRGLSFGLNGSTGWPFGGPTVSARDSAQRIREVTVPAGADHAAAKPGADETIVAVFQDGRRINPATVTGSSEARVYISGPTGMHVKRPSHGGEGLVVNHYDRGALDRYLSQVIEPTLKAGGGIVKSLGCDSLEVYGSNWTHDLPDVFRKRKGYDLTDHLPELFDQKSMAGRGVRFDFWQTLAELTEERFTKPLGEWCGERGLALEMEPYGTPPNPMTSSRYIQTPTGEHYEWKGFSVQKYVSSAAHQAGRPVISAEAWTWAGLPNRLADSLSDLKLVSDMTFLAGANDLVAVDFPYSPRSAGAPGWTPYYGPFMGPGNSQWPMFPALTAYNNRCQWMLRQGDPVRNVAIYLAVEDSFREGPTEQMTLDFYIRDRLVTGKATSEFGLNNGLKHQSDLIHGLISTGFDYDGIDFWSINRVAAIKDGQLAVGPAHYKAIILPNLETMDLAALRKVLAFCKAGGTVVATRRLPADTPGFDAESNFEGSNLPALSGVNGPLSIGEPARVAGAPAPGAKVPQTAELRQIVDELFGSTPKPGEIRHVGQGTAEFVENDREAAQAVARRVQPSVQYAEQPVTVGFQHRRTNGRDIFFLANVGPDPVDLKMRLNADGPAEVWDALTGQIRTMAIGRGTDLPGVRAGLHLPPRGSVFVVAGKPTPGALPVKPLPASTREIALRGPWRLRFDGPDAPGPALLSGLGSWTELPAAKFFSGLGAYSTSFDWDQAGYLKVYLTLGDVREAAEVRVNGVKCGIAIVPPFEVEITGALRTGRNKLEITVANLPVNRFIGLPRPDLRPLRKVYGNRFPAPEEHDLMKSGPAPSGLLGPVNLRLEFQSVRRP